MGNWRFFVTLFFLSSLVIGQCAQAQSGYRFRNLDSNDGLSSNLVISMEQDSLGFMWFQDFEAVSRYDGYEFKTYRYDPLDRAGSPHEGLLGKLYKDKDGRIWIGPGVGRYYRREPRTRLARFDFKSEKFIKYYIDLKGPAVRCVDFDSDRRSVWVGTMQNGIFHYDLETNSFDNFVNPDTANRNGFNTVLELVDIGESLILRTGSGLAKFNKQAKTFEGAVYPGPRERRGIWEMSLLSRGPYANHLIAQRYHEILIYDVNLKVVKRFEHEEKYFFEAEADSEGIIWLGGFNNGFYRWDPAQNSLKRIHREPGNPQALSSDILECIAMDRDQHVWIGTEDNGASMLVRPTLHSRNFSFPRLNGVTTLDLNGKPHVVVFDSESIPYYGKPNNTVLVADASSIDSISFRDSGLRVWGLANGFYRKNDSWWIGSDGLHEIKLDSTQVALKFGKPKSMTWIEGNPYSFAPARTTGVYSNRKGDVWVSMKSMGLDKLVAKTEYGKEGSVIHYRHDVNDSTTISSDVVTSVFGEDENSVWVSTQAGLDLYKNGKFTHVLKNKGIITAVLRTDSALYVGTSNGMYFSLMTSEVHSFTYDSTLGNFEVQGLYLDRVGRFWITNTHGLYCYDRTKQSLIKFDATDGIDHYNGFDNFRGNVTMASDYSLSNGLLVTRSHEGITISDPASLKVSTAIVNPVLTGIEVNNLTPPIDEPSADFSLDRHATVLQTVALDYLHNNFTIRFAALEMVAPERNRYRYRLEGYDPRWVTTDWLNRKATYTNLEPGHYKFILQASNHHGVWSNLTRELNVVVLPPPWKTWWAYAGYLIMIIIALVFARRAVLQREKLKTKLRLEHMELEQTKKIDQAKSAFFTNISHEFRTPLTLIKGPASTLQEEFPDNPKVGQSVKLIQHNADLLLSLVNQLLDLSKLEAGSMTINPTEFTLNNFLHDVASVFQPLAIQKNISFEFRPPVKSYRVLLDKEKLDTILRNLLSNAFKFTSKGKVTLQVEVLLHGFDQELSLRVTDTGVGIPQHEQGKVFERFYQVNEGGAHRDLGTGIGLSLVRELANLMGGTIALESEPGRGSSFHVKIPIKVVELMRLSQDEIVHPLTSTAAEITPVEKSEVVNGSVSEKAMVLVVEDNDELRRFIVASFDATYFVREASNGREGLETAHAEVPEIIISDVMMPEMDGFAMLQRLKKDPITSHIPVIMLTAKTEGQNKIEGLSLGADDYLSKPFEKKELILKVRNKIAQQKSIRDNIRMKLLQQATPVQAMSADEQFVLTVKSTIEERITDDQLSVESLSEQLSMSRVQLYRKVVALTGMSVNELIRSLRLQKASILLRQRWGSVSQVAYETGFSNLSYFSKCFKEEFGVLPSEYSSLEK